MIKSYSNKITKESFKTEKDYHKIKDTNLKLRDGITAPKLNRVQSAQTTHAFYTNREKPLVNTKSKLETQKTKDLSAMKKEFKTVKEPIRIKTLKSANNIVEEKVAQTPSANPSKLQKKFEDDVKNNKERVGLKFSKQRSYESLNERVTKFFKASSLVKESFNLEKKREKRKTGKFKIQIQRHQTLSNQRARYYEAI